MAHRRKRQGVIRGVVPSERHRETAVLLLGGVYSLLIWTAIILQAWQQAARITTVWSP